MILLPGVRSARVGRRSQLAFYWHARNCTLQALTGQQGTLVNVGTGTAGNSIVPAVGSTLVAGSAQPRFTRAGAVNVLALVGNLGGQDIERLTFLFGVAAMDLTLLLRLQGLWTPGASMTGGVASIGITDANAGAIRIWKTTTSWLVGISKGGSSISSSLAENAALVWPADVLVTYARATGIVSLTLRSANGTLYGPITAGNGSFAGSGRFGGETMALGYDAVVPSNGVPMWLHFAKIAGGIQTYAQMEVLA